MRIVIDARYLNDQFTGIGTYSLRFLRALAALNSDHEFHVIHHSSFSSRLNLGPNFQLHPHPAPPVSRESLWGMKTFLERLEPDLVHTTFPLVPVLYKGPLVVTFHDIQPMLDPHFHSARPFYIVAAYKAFYQLAYRMAARKANYILCDSHYTRKALAQWYPPAHPKSITVPLGISKEASEPVSDDLFEEALEEYPIPPRYLLYLGSTRPNKNLANMLQGFMEYKRRHPEDSIKWVLVIRPDRFFEPLFRTLREKQLLGEVIVLEQVTEAHKRALISRAQAMTFVTMYEGFGFPVLEAQAQGVPCVAAHHGSIPEVAGTDGAYLVDPLDPQAIAAGLEAILLNPNLRQRIQEAGLKNIHRFSWETHARETLAVYDHLIETLPEARQRHPAMDPS